MTRQRVPFSKDADNRLRALKSRTGITPNVLCRMGFCLSLEEPGVPIPVKETDLQGRVINRFTLLGEHDGAFIALLITWMQMNDIEDMNDEVVDTYFLSHVHRGVEILWARVKSLVDLDRLTLSLG